MKKIVGLTFAVLLIAAGTLLILNFGKLLFAGYGALQITTNIKSKAYIDDKFIGDTPLCKCKKNEMLKEREYVLKIVPEDKSFSPFSHKIKINKNVLTAVDRTFVPGSNASAYVLTLEKNNNKEPEILITSIPEGALVSIDNTPPQGITPFLLKNISEAEHDLEISKDGFGKKTMRVKTIAYYKLVADIILGSQENSQGIAKSTPTPTITPTPTSKTAQKKVTQVKILSTPNGFLRVRKGPSLSDEEITRIQTGDIVTYVDEQNGWIKIELSDETVGWISADFAEKVEPR